ncbi:egl-20, partial [Pristionchus pacificus]
FAAMRLLLLLLMLLQAALAVVYNWLSLALLNTSTLPIAERGSMLIDKAHYEGLCAHLTGLNPVQQQICTSHPFSIPFVSRGLRDAIYECQQQFKMERWNCSDRYEIMKTPYGYFHDILGKTLRTTTKESSYLAAIASAGIVYAVTKGCNTGNFSDCGCDSKPALQRHLEAIELNPPSAAALTSMHPGGPVPYPPPPGMPSSAYPPMGSNGMTGNGPFSWGGCSDNVGYGVRYARKFLDEFERQEFNRTSNVQHLVAMHNHFVGREAIVQNVRKHCRCHGVSGSCEFKTCWLQMPKMKDVAELLKKRYDNFAVQVTKRAKKRLRRKERSERATPIRGNEMAFVVRSPTYCERNDTAGILGTAGRDCVHDSLNADSCDLLCCGRGYNTRIERQVTQCNCKFVWCCQVKCKECVDDVALHTCK